MRWFEVLGTRVCLGLKAIYLRAGSAGRVEHWTGVACQTSWILTPGMERFSLCSPKCQSHSAQVAGWCLC